ncbi:hypothetical protein E6O75_ATG01797 [Venturia nashicola]|uniref:Uncharacterized protein n=1 Tax=Venturia nashicola TaxID=86259 RepID=A0A4Z1NH30_9PEZI|nr:hypothetical protein E6O75_ATG01797 [Venturia nashicola]
MERVWRIMSSKALVTVWRFLGLHVLYRLPVRVEQCTQPVETDDVYPVHSTDECTQHRGTILVWTLAFNDILDPGLLQKSLTELLNIGDWRKFGGRFRVKNDGCLEIHVPRPFTEDRPAIAFHHSSFQCNIEEHPSGKTYPRATKNPATLAPPDYHGLAFPTGSPRTLADLLNTDRPLLTLHVSSFENATLVTLTYSHIIMDAMAMGVLLHAWSLVLSGKSSQVPTLLGTREDSLDAVASNLEAPAASEQDYIMGQKPLKGWRMGIFILHYVWNLLWNSIHNAETKVCFLPKKALENLRERAQNDLASLSGHQKPPFVSDGDIISAWYSTIVARSLSRSSPVTLMQTLNLRFRFAALKNKGVYMGNMLLPGYTLLPQHAEQLSLGQIAFQHRKDLLEQTTEPNMLTHLRETLARKGRFLLFGPSHAVFAPVSNWTKGDFFAARFEDAVTGVGDTSPDRKNPPGTITFHWATIKGSVHIAPILIVLGRDLEGNYWFQSCLRRSAWLILEQALRELV